MKTTITAVPRFISCEESTIHLSHGKLIESTLPTGKSTLYKSIPLQLILISLDEKIKDGDLMMDLRSLHYGRIVKCIGNSTSKEYEHWYKGEDNVILSPTQCAKVIALQSQLSPEYIQQVISEYNNGGMKDVEIKTIGKIGESKIDYVPITDNGFITIVEKEIAVYTYNEVITFLQQYRYDLASGKTPMIGDTTKDWFNNNKKK